jgi:hypothetical protein
VAFVGRHPDIVQFKYYVSYLDGLSVLDPSAEYEKLILYVVGPIDACNSTNRRPMTLRLSISFAESPMV